MLKNTPEKTLFYLLMLAFSLLIVSCQQKYTSLKIAVTTDVHGMIFPMDFIGWEKSDHSLAHIYYYVSEQRALSDTLFFLLDNGDFLQGQPTVYYYNFMDTLSPHLSARAMNYLGYDAGSVGNHDIEAGPAVYDRIREEFNFPWLAANAVKTSTGDPYFQPYTILDAGKKRIAVLGMITPGIPNWLPKNLWPQMEFKDMVETARYWVPQIMKEENPDLLVGLFHSGTDASYGGNTDSYLNENAVLLVAEQVPGFDIIFAGHDHRVSVNWTKNLRGDSVLIIDPGSHARYAGEATITFGQDGLHISGKNVPMTEYTPSEEFVQLFAPEYETVSAYLRDTITWLAEDMAGLEALWGPSAMMSLIHQVQLELSGAQISFTAPLSLTALLEKGPLRVSDMFKLYRFENMLYTMKLSGEEIDGFLEHAVGNWFNTLDAPSDHLLLFDPGQPGRLAFPYYNFSSAAGINYFVDVSKDPGDRVRIQSFSNGAPFNKEEIYSVALNSYRGNGGGGHLSEGAGIPKEELSSRITWSTQKDLRFYLMDFLGKQDTLFPKVLDNWHLLPESLVPEALAADRRIMKESFRY
jgi:2',3'-cyclic-nucleotide 2'-phosphodiesterase/3'-nucleotidase